MRNEICLGSSVRTGIFHRKLLQGLRCASRCTLPVQERKRNSSHRSAQKKASIFHAVTSSAHWPE